MADKWVNEKFKKQMKAEAETMREDMLEQKLFTVMEVAEYPSKWRVEGMELIEVYAHPVVDSSYSLKKIVYRPYKFNLEKDLPAPLLEAYNKLMREIELVSPKPKLMDRVKGKKARKPYVRITEEIKAEMIRMYHMGESTRDIAKNLDISIYSVRTYITKHKQEVQVDYEK